MPYAIIHASPRIMTNRLSHLTAFLVQSGVGTTRPSLPQVSRANSVKWGDKVVPLSAAPSSSPLLGRLDGVDQITGEAADGSGSLPPRTPLLTRFTNAVEFSEHETMEGVSLLLLSNSNPFRIFLAKVNIWSLLSLRTKET